MERFWSKAEIKGPDDCWPWQRATDKDGYGWFQFDGKARRSNRMAFYLDRGYWPVGFCLHSCDNPPCVNPAHLSDGTPADNTREMIERGRQSRGEDHANAKLSDDEVREIRRRYATGSVSQEALGVEYGVSGVHIGNIVRGRQRV